MIWICRQKLGDRKGTFLIPLALIVIGIVISAGVTTYSLNMAEKRAVDSNKAVIEALYLAEEGLGMAYTEIREHGGDWVTHTMDISSGVLSPVTGPVDVKVQGATLDANGDYMPFGQNKDVRVRIYKDANNNLWAVVKVNHKGVTRVVRASMVVGSLLEFFHFYPRWHRFYGNFYADGRGFGKIYVGGSVRFDGRATFKNIAMFSTSADGYIYVGTSNKEPPYAWDMNKNIYGDYENYEENQHLDGWGLLPMRKNEFYDGYNISGSRYVNFLESAPNTGSEAPTSGDIYVKDPIQYFNERSKWNNSAPRFIFDQDVMGSRLNLNGKNEVEIWMPSNMRDTNGNPINYKFDIYRGKDADAVGEKPVKFIRAYKKVTDENGNERWIITKDLATADYVQVFDGRDTVNDLGMSTIEVEYKDQNGNWQKKNIPVKEDGITVTYYQLKTKNVSWTDEEGKIHTKKVVDKIIPHNKTYDVDEEKRWWVARYGNVLSIDSNTGELQSTNPKILDYVQNGFTREDAEYTNFGYPEYDGFNALNTSVSSHAARFKEWLEGNYRYGAINGSDPWWLKYQKKYEQHDVDLTGIIKEGSTGAVTLEPVEIKDTMSLDAQAAGIWIGYEKVGEQKKLVIYENGNKVYEEGNSNYTKPDWVEFEEFTTGTRLSCSNHNTNCSVQEKKARTVTLDFDKLQSVDPTSGKSVLDEINGVIWVNYKEGGNEWVNRAVKIKNADVISRQGGVTIATPQSIMIQGDFNAGPNPQPCALVTDSYVYSLSDHFSPPNYTPAVNSPVLPYNNINDFLKHKFGNNYMPDPNKLCTNPGSHKCVVKVEKRAKEITKAIEHYYYNTLSKDVRKVAAPSRNKIKQLKDLLLQNGQSWDWRDIQAKLEQWFKEDHAPKIPIYDEQGNLLGYKDVPGADYQSQLANNLAPGMPMVADDQDDREVVVNAALISSEARGDSIKYIENWSWFDPSVEYTNAASLKIEGMFPHVISKNSQLGDRWSKSYSKYDFSSGINGGPAPQYIAHDFSNASPPGDLTYVGLSVYYIEKDPDMFDRHPL